MTSPRLLLFAFMLELACSRYVAAQCTGTTVSTFPYIEGFEAVPARTSGGVGNYRARGTPAHPLINSAGGGANSWCVGGLTATG